MNYEEIKDLPLGSLVTYREYDLDRRERKRLKGEAYGVLVRIIAPSESLSGEEVKVYYGLSSDQNTTLLSSVPSYRIVLETDTNSKAPFTTIHLSSYFLAVGLQEVDYKMESLRPETPSSILGFSSYEVGRKFRY